MPQIPLYQQKATPTTQAPSAMADAGSAAAPFRALEQLGGTVSKIGFELQDRMDKEETDAQTASYMADRKVRSNALEQQLSVMTDPDEIEEFYTQWREDEQNILNESRLNKNSRRAITNNYEDFYATADIAASGYHRKAKIAGFDRGYIDAQNLALNNETDPTIINPATGKSYTPSELYEYATMKRVDIGTIDYEDAVGDIREFDEEFNKRIIERNIAGQISIGTSHAITTPRQTIDNVDDQLSGESTTYPELGIGELKQIRTEAEKQLAKNQNEASDLLYMPDSNYQGMTVDEKRNELRRLANGGMITGKTYSREMDELSEPVVMQPEHVGTSLDFQQQLMIADRDAESHRKILEGVMEDSLPKSEKEALMRFSRDILDPTSTWNSKRVGYSFDQVDEAFKVEDVVADPSATFLGIGGIPAITELGWKGKKEFEDRYEAIVNTANYEVKKSVLEWMQTEGKDAGIPEIQRKVADEILSARERYGIKNIKGVMESMEPTTTETTTDKKISNADALAALRAQLEGTENE